MARYLAIGIDEFDELRTLPEGLYVDKTELTAALADRLLGRTPQLLLARPRRFGKTLLISTLQALFQGQRTLFEGTWLGQRGHWDWPQRQYPVLRLDMDLRDAHSRPDLESHLVSRLTRLARQTDVTVDITQRPAPLLEELIEALYRKHRRPLVVLVDEYDTPIAENMDRPETLDDALSVMRAFYGALKGSRRYLRCTFMTGVTRMALAGLFSGANHFRDLSFSPSFNALLGFTQEELRQNEDLRADIAQCAAQIGYAPDAMWEALRIHYDGYRFSADAEAVYNPFSLAQCLEAFRETRPGTRWAREDFPNAWADSGTPALLFRLWQTGRFDARTTAWAEGQDALPTLRNATFSASRPDRDVLLYHAGYLTLKPQGPGRHGLDFPNQEVQLTFETSLTAWQGERVRDWHRAERAAGHPGGQLIREALLNGDEQGLQARIDDFLQQFPYPGQALPAAAQRIYNYEMHYRNAVFNVLWAMGLTLRVEDATARGRTDIVIEAAQRIWVLECKLNGSAAQALKQVWDKGYVDPYRTLGKPVVVFGLNFDRNLRTITDIAKWELGPYDLNRQRWAQEPLAPYTLTALSRMGEAQRARILDEGARSGNGDRGAAHIPR